MKKFLIVTCLFCLFSSTGFTREFYTKTPFDGWYLGLGSDYSDVDFYNKYDRADGTRVGTEVEDTTTGPAIIGGGGGTSKNFYFGAEMQIMPARAETHQKNHGYNITANLDFQKLFGIDMNVGVLPARRWLLFAILGVEMNKFEVEYYYNNMDTFDHDDRLFFSLHFGAGTEVAVTDHIRFRAAYTYGDRAETEAASLWEKDKYEVNEELFRLAFLYTL